MIQAKSFVHKGNAWGVVTYLLDVLRDLDHKKNLFTNPELVMKAAEDLKLARKRYIEENDFEALNLWILSWLNNSGRRRVLAAARKYQAEMAPNGRELVIKEEVYTRLCRYATQEAITPSEAIARLLAKENA